MKEVTILLTTSVIEVLKQIDTIDVHVSNQVVITFKQDNIVAVTTTENTVLTNPIEVPYKLPVTAKEKLLLDDVLSKYNLTLIKLESMKYLLDVKSYEQQRFERSMKSKKNTFFCGDIFDLIHPSGLFSISK